MAETRGISPIVACPHSNFHQLFIQLPKLVVPTSAVALTDDEKYIRTEQLRSLQNSPEQLTRDDGRQAAPFRRETGVANARCSSRVVDQAQEANGNETGYHD